MAFASELIHLWVLPGGFVASPLRGLFFVLEGERLDVWLEEAEACGAPAMGNFAAGLRKDLDAVRAGITEEWSNGPMEGFVLKLKLVKRQGYGRAGFDLLRARMLAP